MKSQFREKTGKELPKFTPQKGGLSRQSRQGSESSLSSLVLEPSAPIQGPSTGPATLPVQTQDVQIRLSDGKVLSPKEVSILSKKEEEWRHRIEKKEAEWAKKLEKREVELLQESSRKEEEWKKKEQSLLEDLLKQTNELRDALRAAEDYKKKICQYQEDKDQLEGFQTQEMAKIKHLLLAKEKESAETATALKESLTLVESLKAEVSRLRPLEEKISNYEDDIEMLRHTSEKERWNLSSKLAQSEEQVRHLTDRVAVLTRRSESGAGTQVDDRVQALLGERALLERRLEEAHVHLTDIKASWSAQISSLETQVGRLSRQAGEEGAERRRAESRVAELEAKLEEEAKLRDKITTKSAKLSEEVDSLASELKGANALIDKDKTTISDLTRKLRDTEESLLNLTNTNARLEEELQMERTQHSQVQNDLVTMKQKYEQELNETVRSLDAAKEELKNNKTKCEKLSKEVADLQLSEKKSAEEVTHLQSKLDALSQESTEIHKRLEDMKRETEKEKSLKEDALLRNAQVSQEMDIAKAELRHQASEHEELFKKVSSLESAVSEKEQELKKAKEDYAQLLSDMSALQTEAETKQAAVEVEQSLREKIANLEQQVAERNKNIRVLHQKLSDMKKTLQRELKSSDMGGGDQQMIINNHNSGFYSGNQYNSNHPPPFSGQGSNGDDEVNFLYLKHVIMKFLTSREYEVAQHLTRAVATLLKLSPEEECLLKDTLDWKMSWFGSKPRLQDYSHS